MRKGLAALFALMLVALAACDTERPENGTNGPTTVTPTSATLRAKGNYCYRGYNIWWWFESRDVDPNLNNGGPTPWYQIGQKQRMLGDCANPSEIVPVKQAATTLNPEHRYQYRMAYTVDGFPGEGACDSNARCEQKGTAPEAQLVYDDFTTPARETGQVGEDYDVNLGSGSVSGTYACDYDLNFSPAVLIGQYSHAATLADCRNDMDVKVTCKAQLHIGNNVWYDTDYSDDQSNSCYADAYSSMATISYNVGGHYDWYVRLNQSNRRWTSAFRKTPHRGGCETYYTNSTGVYLHVLHCWATYGKLGSPPT